MRFHRPVTRLLRHSLALPCALLLHVANAETEQTKSEAKNLERVTVEGAAQPRLKHSLAIEQMEAEKLGRRSAATLGATLQDELGVANASFGPNVGLPLIRGQGGSRTKVMFGGIGSHDASSVSADHGAMVESGLAERLTLHKGPATIRFGGGAIGGAVEIEDERIPELLPAANLLLRRGELRGERNAGLAIAKLGGAVGGALAWHADIHSRRNGAVPIPGWAIDEAALQQQFGLINGRNSWGHIDNSDARSTGGALGASWLGQQAMVGLALSQLAQDYGLPPGGHTHHHGDATTTHGGADHVRIQAQQRRLELRAEQDRPWAWAKLISLRASTSRYAHDELDAGRVTTRFENDVSEARLELEHQILPSWSGVWGLQVQDRLFSALGAEAFVPLTQIRTAGLFALEQWKLPGWQLELGLRADYQQSTPPETFPVLGLERPLPVRHFWPGSLSLALQRGWGGGSLSATYWHMSRAPDVQELYAGGPHIATRSFDFGNTGLSIETLQGWDLGLQQSLGAWTLRGNAYLYRSHNYIYQRTLGWFYQVEESQAQAACTKLDLCLPATKYEQDQVQIHGYEAELSWTTPLPGAPVLALFSDQVRGRLHSGADLPRMAPQRVGLSALLRSGPWVAELRATHALAQTRPGDNELPSAAYTAVNAHLRWTHRLAGAAELGLFVNARNLGNAEIRNSTSFMRHYAPEPGRSIQLGLEYRHQP